VSPPADFKSVKAANSCASLDKSAARGYLLRAGFNPARSVLLVSPRLKNCSGLGLFYPQYIGCDIARSEEYGYTQHEFHAGTLRLISSGMAVMSARKALFTASGVVNTSATSGSKTTTNGVLTAEMDSISALSAQICPQFGFGRSLLSTQFARTMDHLRRGAFGFLDELLLPAPSQPPPFS